VIAIHKSAAPPVLVHDGEEHATDLCAAYDADPDLYVNREQKMPIRRLIYASEAVKAALGPAIMASAVIARLVSQRPTLIRMFEHWRPKSSSRQGFEEESIWPGYYWLAYSWDNLLLSCAFCNSSNKSDLFPLEDPTVRARHHRMRIEDETPVILKPDGDEDPRNHITFHMEVPVGLTPLGRKTIEVLGSIAQRTRCDLRIWRGSAKHGRYRLA